MSYAELSIREKLEIIKEKHSQLYEVLKSNEIDCWVIFARETETTPDSVMEFVVGNDVVIGACNTIDRATCSVSLGASILCQIQTNSLQIIALFTKVDQSSLIFNERNQISNSIRPTSMV